MKTTTDGWWDYWNNVEFKRMLEGNFDGGHGIAKIILWLYENHLIEKGKSGYGLKRYDTVEKSQCEHIAPNTENQDANSGYCPYDDEFRESYLNCLGNYCCFLAIITNLLETLLLKLNETPIPSYSSNRKSVT